jgi:hypothetical protein
MSLNVCEQFSSRPVMTKWLRSCYYHVPIITVIMLQYCFVVTPSVLCCPCPISSVPCSHSAAVSVQCHEDSVLYSRNTSVPSSHSAAVSVQHCHDVAVLYYHDTSVPSSHSAAVSPPHCHDEAGADACSDDDAAGAGAGAEGVGEPEGGESPPSSSSKWRSGQSAMRWSEDLQWWQRLGMGPWGHLAAMWFV